MLKITRTGSIADVIAAARDIPSRVIPYAASAALTRSAKAAERDIVSAMPTVFDRPVPYTLKSLRVWPSTVNTLSARVGVKSDAPNNGTPAEDYILPSVIGGGRREKRFERAMRYAGLLQRGEFAVLGQGAPVDAYGNLSRGEIQRILTVTRSAFDPYQRKTNSRRSRKNARKAPYFAARIGRAGKPGTWGIWQRDGKTVHPVLIFTRKAPQYRARLPFEAIAQAAAAREFPREFAQAAAAIIAKRGTK